MSGTETTTQPLRITALLPRANDGSLGDRSWKDAAIRIRCASIAPHLGRLGAVVKLVESQYVGRRIADGSFFDADVFVIYQTLEDHRRVVEVLADAGKCVVADVCDDVATYQGVLGYTWDNARRAAGVTVPTRSLADRLAGRLSAPIRVVADAVEGEAQPPRPPRTDGPLRLFWYGWQHKVGVLAERLPALAAFARRRPLELTIMTNVNPIGPVLQGVLDAADDSLVIRATAWERAAFNRAMADADLAVIPYNDSVAYSGRSPVRLIQALWQGRLAVSEDLEGYPQFARFGLLHRSIVDGIAWVVERPDEAAQCLAAAQRHVFETYRPSVLAATWLQVLTEIHAGFTAPARPAR